MQLYILAFLSLLIFGEACSNSPKVKTTKTGSKQSFKTTIIAGTITRPSSDSVTFYGYLTDCDQIKYMQPLAGAQVDAKGNFVFNLNLNRGTEFNIKNGDRFLIYGVFVSPGDSMYMKFDSNRISMDGRGADKLDFAIAFADTFLIGPPLANEYRDSYKNLELPDYLVYLNKRRQQELQFFDSYFKNKPLDTLFDKYEKSEINYKYAIDKLQYLWKHNYSLKISGSIHPEPTYFQFPNDISVEDSNALISPTYFMFLREYITSLWGDRVELQSPEERKRSYKTQFLTKYRMVDSTLKGEFSDIVKAELLIERLQHLPADPMEVLPVKATIDSLRTLLRNTPFTVCMDSIVQREYVKAFSLQGKPAPDFQLKSLDGSTLNFSDFKGKVILLDFWATNCAPCIKEIPYANALQDRFKDKDFKMIGICCNSSMSDWHSIVQTNKWKGIHLYNDSKILMNLYNINGYPNYILVDKKGIIYSTNAARPSSQEIDKEIINLLEGREK